MKYKSIVEAEINSIDWRQFSTSLGRGDDVADRLRALVYARNEADAQRAYFDLENTVVVQGTPFSSGIPSVRVLLAALLDDDIPERVVGWIVELLYQVAIGNGDIFEDNWICNFEDYSYRDLYRRIHSALRRGYWLLKREFHRDPEDDRLGALIDVIEPLRD